jgi:hypothetical protein
MWSHLSEGDLVDRLEGGGVGQDHLARCSACAARLAGLREGWRAAGQADGPEPSPLYWEAFRRRVGRQLEEGARARGRGAWLAPALVGAGAAVVAAVLLVPRATPPPSPMAGALPAWTALPPEDADAGLDLLEVVAAEGGWDAAWPSGGGLAWVEGLTEEDAVALAEALRGDVAGEGRS